MPKNIILVLSSYSGCEREEQACQDRLPQLHNLQSRFDSCIRKGLSRTGPQVTLVPHAGAQENLALRASVAELAAGKQVSVTRLAKDETGIKLDYLVSIAVEKRSSERQFRAEVVAADPGAASGFIVIPPTVLWGFGQEWTNSATIRTRIYSAGTGRLAGELSADLSKDAFWVLPVITVVPLVPVGWSPNVETRSCEEMGEALGRFFSGAGNAFLE